MAKHKDSKVNVDGFVDVSVITCCWDWGSMLKVWMSVEDKGVDNFSDDSKLRRLVEELDRSGPVDIHSGIALRSFDVRKS
jgi:hypothetical protein